MASTVILLSLAGLFTLYEFVAHFIFRNRTLKTASFEIRAWEGRRLGRRVAVLGALTVVWVLLILHLVLKLF